MGPGEQLGGLLGERQLLVVALEQREVQLSGDRRLEAGGVGDHGDQQQAHEAGRGEQDRAGAPVPDGDHRVEQERVDGDDHEADERHSPEAGEGPRRGHVVQADPEVAPRESALGPSAEQRLHEHPDRRGDPR